MTRSSFKSVAIVNRGEPAVRLLHAVHELDRERGTRTKTIALYTTPDRRSMFVREADQAISLGPPTYIDPRDGKPKSSYLDYKRLEQALTDSGAEAVWVGWGFVAEHAEFAELCARLGIVFIGPPASVMRRLGDKIASKHLAEQARVPVAPWSGGPVSSLDEARVQAERLGFPLVVKASAGGGGRGIRKVSSEADLESALRGARAEALAAFGDETLFMERQIAGARHVEVQIIADHHGTIWSLGVRDCTIQRRNQKVIEESPSPALSAEQHRELDDAAVRLAHAAAYRNAGTVEFLFQPDEQAFYFMEVNTRLQVEHPVTELTTGADLVKLQLAIAGGERLPAEPPPPCGHAIEARLNAEDPDNGFVPAPGTIELFKLPCGPGLRIDTGVSEGDVVPPEFDSMIAKIIAHGRTRAEAMARLQRALADCRVVIRGGACNKGFLLDLLDDDDVRQSRVDVQWLDRKFARARAASETRRHAEVALLQAAVDAYDAELALERARFLSSASHGRPQVDEQVGRTIELGYQNSTYSIRVRRLGPQLYRLVVDDQAIELRIEHRSGFERRIVCGTARHHILSIPQGPSFLVEVDGVPHRLSLDSGGVVRAPAPAVVVSIAVEEGDRVAVGDRLLVLEAMKTETALVASFAGVVRQILVVSNVQVAPGTPLLVITPESQGHTEATSSRASFTELAKQSAAAAATSAADRLRSLMLGFDVDPDEAPLGLPADDPDSAAALQLEEDILGIFADVCSLFRPRPSPEDLDQHTELGRVSTKEYFFAYLRDLGAKGQGLPEGFVGKLRRALSHYGMDSLEPCPELEESLFRIWKSRRRSEAQSGPILALLERRLDHVEGLVGRVQPSFATVLDRIVDEVRDRFPSVTDLAREVRYRYFTEPLLQQGRDRAYAEMERHLAYLRQHPDAPDRAECIAKLVDCPHPLKTFLSLRACSEADTQQLMLEVMTRRYYRIRDLQNLRHVEVDGESMVSAEYDRDLKRIHVLAAHLDYAQLPDVAAKIAVYAKDVPADHDLVIDLYAWQPGPKRTTDELQQEIVTALNEVPFNRRVRRIVVTLSGPRNGTRTGVEHFTYRPAQRGFEEERAYRDIHPMHGKRMHIWRLSKFDIERLPSGEEVFLFRAVAREQPTDERLFVLAEVRNLTATYDSKGRVTSLPCFEHTLNEALAAIRWQQAHRSPKRRLKWNRVMLFVWPPLTIPRDAINDLVYRLAPATQGLGLEKVIVHARVLDEQTGELRDRVLDVSKRFGGGVEMRFRRPSTGQMRTLDPRTQQLVQARQRGLIDAYELIRTLAPPAGENVQSPLPPGDFQEYDLDADQQLVPVTRPPGQNRANIIVGLIRNLTSRYPEGMARVLLMGDPSSNMGSLAEPECLRIAAGLDLAEKLRVPVEWFAISAGAKIAMDSGVENMDWIAMVLRRLVQFTQAGGEVNIIVCGVNVGAQPYWNAEATMLMHTRGILIMTPSGSMVLTGKRALDYSGGVSADDNEGIGGYERVMGPNGQAQYFAEDLSTACRLLLRHYDFTYVAPGERFPRRATTTDAIERSVCSFPHGRYNGYEFETVGEIFSAEKNPGRKRPFDIRKVMRATIDQDQEPLERWFNMRSAEMAVVWDVYLGGYPVCLLGLESRPLSRLGFIPADGPETWSAGTLFPLSSKKVARAINSASGNRPVVVLANLSGFDGSPESMRNLQLEHGAEIGRAVVNFDGPMIFCVISRYHGGAFVVFSNRLNDQLEVAALEGSYASVIGGAPAAAVVFAREVSQRAHQDPRVQKLLAEIAQADGAAAKARLRRRHDEVFQEVHSEKLGQVAEQFDGIHNIHRAQKVGAVHRIIPAAELRPYLIDAVERGIRRSLERAAAK